MSTWQIFLMTLIVAPFGTADCRAASDLPVTVIAAPQVEPLKINLAEDEVILPPYLVRFDGGSVLNVTPATKPPRNANAKELLDFGDAFRLLPKLAFQVIAKEHFQWVGGGVFEGRFLGPMIAQNEVPYGFRIDRGWARVWVDEPDPGIRILTPAGKLEVKTADFWMSVQNGVTDLYVYSGSIVGASGRGFRMHTLDPAGIELLDARIKGVYPTLWELARKGNDDWKSGDPEKIYSELRKKGFRKASRMAPKSNEK